jgi:hypothetical protein
MKNRMLWTFELILEDILGSRYYYYVIFNDLK